MLAKNDSLQDLITEIEQATPQQITIKPDYESFRLRFYHVLLENLSGGVGTLLVRAILNKLQIDEHRLFKWRLENKYRQYQILNCYSPGCMAETFGFSELLDQKNGIQRIKDLCSTGYFVKATLGDGSGRANSFDRTEELAEIIAVHECNTVQPDQWVIQKKLNITTEFRIHSFDGAVISGLSFLIAGDYLPNIYGAEEFLQKVLQKLPDTLIQGSLIGWDIALTDQNQWYVIEANITGFHPDYGRGFQSSGYFGDPDFGPVICAWFNTYFKYQYHLSISAIDEVVGSYAFYQDFLFYTNLFTADHLEIIRKKTQDAHVVGFIYIEEDLTDQMATLLSFFRMQRFCDRYYVFVPFKYLQKAGDLLMDKPHTYLFNRDEMFSEDEQELIKHYTPSKRKETYFSRMQKAIPADAYFLI